MVQDKSASALGRRHFLRGSSGLAAIVGLSGASTAQALVEKPSAHPSRGDIVPFFGVHQGGITTPTQDHTYFAVFDIETAKLEDLTALLQAWTDAAAKICAGQPSTGDSGEATGLSPARLTLTFGFGPELFSEGGVDRFGLAARRPAALVDLPRFNGDQLVAERTGGDLSVQACGDDPQIVFHAVRQLARLGAGVVRLRWVQTGFSRSRASTGTARNLMGFKDGTRNLDTGSKAVMDQRIWVGTEGPDWMRGGSYMVTRRIRIALEHWDRVPLDFQEQVVGRHKDTGAPIGGHRELDKPDFAAVDTDGNPVIPENSHLRLGAPETNNDRHMLRRGYAYNDGANMVAERWPPWHQGLEYDAGLLFVAYQKDPREAFIPVFHRMAQLDAMNQFTTHVGSGIFACPGGVRPGGFIGEGLFEGVRQTKIYPVGPQTAPASKTY